MLFPATEHGGPETDPPYQALADLCAALPEAAETPAFLARLCRSVADTFYLRDVAAYALASDGTPAWLARAGEPSPVPARIEDAWPDQPLSTLNGDLSSESPEVAALCAGTVPYLWHGFRRGEEPWGRVVVSIETRGETLGLLTLILRGAEAEFAASLLPALAPFRHLAAMALRHARGEAIETRCAARLAALQHLSGAVVSHADLDDFLGDACETLVRVTGVDLAAVSLADATGDGLKPCVVRGMQPSVPGFYDRFSIDERLARRAWTERGLQLFHGLQSDASSEARMARAIGLESAACVPLWLRDRFLGVLMLGSKSAWRPPGDVAELVIAVGHQLSAAIANAALLDQARRQMEEQRERSEELQVLHDVSQAMVKTNSLEARLNEIARGLTRVTGTTHCAIFRVERDGLVPWVCYGVADGQSSRFYSMDLPPDEVKRMLKRARKGAFVVSGGARDPFVKSEWLREQQICVGLWLPFHLERHITGVALCYRPGESPTFDGEQIRLAGAIASQGAIALRMSQAFEHERNIADTLQRGLLPNVVRRMGHFEIGNTYHPALHEASVGGDFYDVFLLPDDRVALLMADVSGKGLSAAMQTAMIRNMLRLVAFEEACPAATLIRLNRAIAHYTDPELFVTAFYGVLSPATGELQYANAGHDCPIWYRAAERYSTALDTTGMALGMDPESHYSARRLYLEKGDVLLLYTDGITDARQGESFFGRERLEELLGRFADNRPARIVRFLYREARTYSDSALHDDVALLCLKAKR
jgi:sigma-B regulation protein RsbU (phosphoserine phosphatase)